MCFSSLVRMATARAKTVLLHLALRVNGGGSRKWLPPPFLIFFVFVLVSVSLILSSHFSPPYLLCVSIAQNLSLSLELGTGIGFRDVSSGNVGSSVPLLFCIQSQICPVLRLDSSAIRSGCGVPIRRPSHGIGSEHWHETKLHPLSKCLQTEHYFCQSIFRGSYRKPCKPRGSYGICLPQNHFWGSVKVPPARLGKGGSYRN